MLGTIVNSLAIIVGSIIGLFIKGGISEKVNDTILKGIGLCVIYIGISGSLENNNTIITIICIAIGGLIGELLDLDKRLNGIGEFIENKLNKRLKNNDSEKVSIAQGFVSSSLIFCVGAMAIVGSLESGLQNNHEILFTKSILDGISSIIFTASLGIGVIFSSIAVFIYQGIITIGAGILSGVLSDSVVNSMNVVGSLLIMALGLNMVGATKIKVANLLPAVFIPIILGVLSII
ncbi:DUF554 domain-containing protein [Paraclostridium bifermentans]|uniref:DUF554 domain-containing protein n=1 Tax=Paraclostridium bifermentans TaxID=1490 RepID=UPI00359C5375